MHSVAREKDKNLAPSGIGPTILAVLMMKFSSEVLNKYDEYVPRA
jgi:hypothetical protein